MESSLALNSSEKFNIRKACQLCGSFKTRELFRTSEWGIAWCLTCTNAWSVPPPGKIDYEEQNFHSKFSFTDIADMPSQWKKGLLMQVKLLARYLSPQAKILEIGCGEGILLKELNRRGFDTCGIEPSKTASATACESRLNVIQGYFPVTEVSGSFDAVVMSHVLEHIQKPIGLLKQVSKLAPGGYVLLAQTNWRGLMPRLYKEKWYAWVPEHHFWHFTPKGLKIIFQKLKWEILKVEYSSLFHDNGIISRIGATLPGFGDQFQLLAHIPID